MVNDRQVLVHRSPGQELLPCPGHLTLSFRLPGLYEP